MTRPRSRLALLLLVCAALLRAPGPAGAQTTTTEETTTSTEDTTTSTVDTTTSTIDTTTSTTETPTTTSSTTEEPTTSTTESTTTSTEPTTTSTESTTTSTEPTTTSTTGSSTTSTQSTTTSTEPTTTSTTGSSTTSTQSTTTSTEPTTSSTTATSTTSIGPTTSTTSTTPTPSTSTTTTVPPAVEQCTNGRDDDGDDLIDCADPDCATNPACPQACPPLPTFASVECRLDALLTRVETTPDIQLERARLVVLLTGTGQAEAAGRSACAGADAKQGRKQLAKAGKRVRQFLGRLRRPRAKRSIPPLVRADFLEDGDALRSALKTLRTTLICPGDATS